MLIEREKERKRKRERSYSVTIEWLIDGMIMVGRIIGDSKDSERMVLG